MTAAERQEALRIARKYSTLAALRDLAAEGYIPPVPVIPISPKK